MTEQMQESSQALWNKKTADWYVKHFGDCPVHHEIVGICRPTQHDCILDIGCGSGTVLGEFAKAVPHGRIVGIDPTPRMIELATQSLVDTQPLPELYTAGSELIPLEHQTVDLAIAVSTFHHWQNVSEGLAEIKRVLKPGGRFVIIDENWDEMDFKNSEAFQELEFTEEQQSQSNQLLKDPVEITRILQEAHFDSVISSVFRKHDLVLNIFEAKLATSSA
ncbi:class I SAM-dependent methyltransferase [Algicola sagamiensis]|uniref:class I SAM-dependent methyltransferase n=1 Tax=Algicola sagamiensis TaxID=163869 RepID=UPI00036A33EA|nr:class I SAM-dependent methyltransferase [Algicola sagamiensis]